MNNLDSYASRLPLWKLSEDSGKRSWSSLKLITVMPHFPGHLDMSVYSCLPLISACFKSLRVWRSWMRPTHDGLLTGKWQIKFLLLECLTRQKSLLCNCKGRFSYRITEKDRNCLKWKIVQKFTSVHWLYFAF